MKFLFDAQLPRRLAGLLQSEGIDAIHTLDLPLANYTSDAEICRLSFEMQRVIVTKDSDFVDSMIVRRQPWKLLLVSTGNIKNKDLESLLLINLRPIAQGLESFDFVELTRTNVLFHF